MWHVRSLVAERQNLAKGGLCGCLMSLVQRLLIITLSAESMHWHKNKGCGGGGGAVRNNVNIEEDDEMLHCCLQLYSNI